MLLAELELLAPLAWLDPLALQALLVRTAPAVPVEMQAPLEVRESKAWSDPLV